MEITIKKPSKFIIAMVSIPLVIMLFFATNIYGYFRFKNMCESEGGLRIYEPLEKNMGWQADDYNNAHVAAQLKYVGFVRYPDKKDGKIYDLRYLGGDLHDDNSFSKTLADESNIVSYKWNYVRKYSVENELRMSQSGYEIYKVENNKLMARFYDFGYQQFENTLLSGSSVTSCFVDEYNGFSALPYEFREIIKVFN